MKSALRTGKKQLYKIIKILLETTPTFYFEGRGSKPVSSKKLFDNVAHFIGVSAMLASRVLEEKDQNQQRQ